MGTSSDLEKRSYTFEARAEKGDNGKNVIVGRPIVYEQKTDLGFFDEIIERGALDKTDLRDVRFLVNHDISKVPLARSRRNNKNSTMQLYVDRDGMEISVTLDTENNADARALYSAVERGDISGMSFMFSVKRDEWDDLESDHPTRRIKEIGTVVEVSAVTFPAYEQTEIGTRCKTALDNARAALDSAREQRGSVDTSALELEKLKAKYLYNV
uniref:Prohead serine protease n=1 Tax=Siphoviridae sp. ctkyH28 TaxID=2827585 RepID=A0A8S5LMX1_9CAUD|nr:MAG TPA: prohead serine protease [Siphoviridae sp. ctkyH28]